MKIGTLNNVTNLQDTTTSQGVINGNSATITTALQNTLSLDGSSPNQMQSTLDMNSNHLINLPAPGSINEPLRLADANTLNGGGTIFGIPNGGTTGQVLTKNSGTNGDASWETPGTGSTTGTGPAVLQTSATINTPTITTPTISSASISGGALSGTFSGTPTFSGSGFISFNNRVNIAANTLVGNPTSGTTSESAFTIGSLTSKPTPTSTDLLVIQDTSTGGLRSTPVSAIGTSAGVSSIAGNSGAFTLGAGITNSTNIILADPSYHQGFIGGLVLSNDSTSPNTVLDIAAGVCCSDDVTTMMKLTSAFTKTTGSWAVGTGNGGLDTGTVTASTWYYVFVIERTDTGNVDILFSASATSPSMPASYTKKRRIGCFRTNASSNILAFVQYGDVFNWVNPFFGDNSSLSLGTSITNYTLTVPPTILCEAIFDAMASNSTAGTQIRIFNPAQTGTGSFQYTSLYVQVAGRWSAASYRIRTNASGQVAAVSSAASTDIGFDTYGWTDTRGK